MRLRLVSFNVNGLRRVVTAFGSLAQLLSALGADIVAVQETKLLRSQLERELALLDGWESFFSFHRGKTGYSGVATFCRRAATTPSCGEEGFTGVHALPAGTSAAAAAVALHPRWAAAGFDVETLRALDSEGRVAITDHGAFVLVNVYGPAITSEERAEERMTFKMQFYQALQLRLDALLAAGRRVVLCGDLNIALSPLDVSGATPEDFNHARPDRTWLRQLTERRSQQPGPTAAGLAGGDDFPLEEEEGAEEPSCSVPFADTFRAFHPRRQQAYTCWNTASGARVNNHGSRIDYILAADGAAVAGQAAAAGAAPRADGAVDAATATACPCPSWVVDADVMHEFAGSDHAPIIAVLEFDDAPSLQPAQSAAAPPPGSSRLLFDGTRQATLMACLARRAVTAPSAPQQPEAQRPQPATWHATHAAHSSGGAGGDGRGEGAGAAAQSLQDAAATSGASQDAPGGGLQVQGAGSQRVAAAPTLPPVRSASGGAGAGAGKVGGVSSARRPGGEAGGQRKLTAFMKPTRPATSAPAGAQVTQTGGGACADTDAAAQREGLSMGHPHRSESGALAAGGSEAAAVAASAAGTAAAPDVDDGEVLVDSLEAQAQAASGALAAAGGLASQEDQAAASRAQAVLAWRQIQAQMQPPRCSGHGEPCVIRTVVKKGPNNGRQFWCCARPDGLPPQGRCQYFAWAQQRQVPGAGGAARGPAASAGGGGSRSAYSNMPQKRPRA